MTLLYSGNLGLGQDLGTVLRAAACFNGETNLHILIIGGGKGIVDIQRLAVELQLENAEFRPPVPLYELPELLASGNIHVICQKSGTEGLLVPSKIYSTLATGRPSLFVGPSGCEVAHIVQDSRSGRVVEPGDVDGAAGALKELVQSRAALAEMGENAREYYEYYFGRQRSVSKIIDIIERAGMGNSH